MYKKYTYIWYKPFVCHLKTQLYKTRRSARVTSRIIIIFGCLCKIAFSDYFIENIYLVIV